MLMEPAELDEEPKAYCAHISGIEHVVVTQAGGGKYEWWRCMVCRTEFRPTGRPATGEARAALIDAEATGTAGDGERPAPVALPPPDGRPGGWDYPSWFDPMTGKDKDR